MFTDFSEWRNKRTEDFRKHLCGVLRDLVLELYKNRILKCFITGNECFNKNIALNNTEKNDKKCTNIYI